MAINEQTSGEAGHRARKRGFASLNTKEKQATQIGICFSKEITIERSAA